MNRNLNPYPEMISDESSGIQVANLAHKIWLEGYEAGREEITSDETRHEANR